MDLMLELERLKKQLDYSIKHLKVNGGIYAKAQCDYRIALAKKELELREQGNPASLVYDVARGDENVAKLKEREISTESVYRANQEAINSIKLQIRLIDNQISREYVNSSENQ